MQMFAQFTRNFKPEHNNENNRQAPKKEGKFWAKFIPNGLGNGQRSKKRYPESTSYFPYHGYDIKPDHTSVTCSNQKGFHKEGATITNRMGGVSINCHFHTGWWRGKVDSTEINQSKSKALHIYIPPSRTKHISYATAVQNDSNDLSTLTSYLKTTVNNNKIPQGHPDSAATSLFLSKKHSYLGK